VIRDGQKISCYVRGEINAKKIIRDMVGRDTDMFYKRGTIITDLTGTLEVRDLYKKNYVSKSSFTMKKGEILGIGGMVGSGRTELVSLIFGTVRADGGEVLLDGKNILPKDPCEAIQRGICLITEDRQKTGLFLGHSTGWNFVSVFINKSGDLLIKQKKGNGLFSEYVKKMEIKTEGANQDVRFLSGGNQQKIVLAKWIHAKGEIVIFDEPTRGIDIGAKEDVYRMIVELANEGKFIIIISSEMPELIAMSDRVLIMKKRKIVAELTGDNITEEKILSYSIGETL
jgi:ribose transport system ATP-binding protein